MRFVRYDSMSQFAKELIEIAELSGDNDAYCAIAICNYDVASQLLQELAKNEQKFKHIDLSAPEICGYLKEYAVMMTERGIYCERMYKPNGTKLRFRGCTVPVYVHGECSGDIESLVNTDAVCFNIFPAGKEYAPEKQEDFEPSVYEVSYHVHLV